MKWVRALASRAIAAAIFWGLDVRHGTFPPAGRLLDPFTGFWRNDTRGDTPPGKLDLPGLAADVRVVWDSRRIPHIFAGNDADLARAQGFITARDRFWQMDFVSRYAAGRLSEILGPSMLESDRFFRRFGLTVAAERCWALMSAEAKTREIMEAYAAGVNAYVRTLGRSDYPVEYKILDCEPEPWTPVRSLLLLKLMSYDMTGFNTDAWMTAARTALGEAVLDELFPFDPPLVDPVIPPGTRWDFVRGAPRPASTAEGEGGGGHIPEVRVPAIAARGASAGDDVDRRAIGSNNWAVSGLRTRSGLPILANDPHLGLVLPSVWYEVQLAAPGLNVRGVSLPGAPLVVIGFNERIAWGFTNSFDDVLDWYAVKFRDASRSEYERPGGWATTEFRTEEFRVRGAKPVIERVAWTKDGPVVRDAGAPAFSQSDVPAGAALRWSGHDPSNELMTVYRLARGRNYDDYVAALASWTCPGQNIAYADAEGTIAIWHQGRFPLREKGQGRYLLDEAVPSDAWRERIPARENPYVRNPERGFISSANQNPTDGTYPYYLGWDFESFERGARINEILARATSVTPEDMVRMQTDTLNLRARAALPPLLESMRGRDFSDVEKRAIGELVTWNFENRAGLMAPSIFSEFWSEFNARTWNDEARNGLASMNWPKSEVTIELILKHPESSYFDDRKTAPREGLGDIAFAAFRAAVKKMTDRAGQPGEKWTWGRWRSTRIGHVAHIPGFGRENLVCDGGVGIVNAIETDTGPSWRLVVALGPAVAAWGILPGGPSGNPGSKYYDSGVDEWAAGKAVPLVFLRSADESNPSIASRTTLRSAR